jgi:hypothetical protein
MPRPGNCMTPVCSPTRTAALTLITLSFWRAMARMRPATKTITLSATHGKPHLSYLPKHIWELVARLHHLHIVYFTCAGPLRGARTVTSAWRVLAASKVASRVASTTPQAMVTAAPTAPAKSQSVASAVSFQTRATRPAHGRCKYRTCATGCSRVSIRRAAIGKD